MKNNVGKQLLDDLSDLEQAIESTAYNAVFSGINNALRDLGLGGQVSPKEVAATTAPTRVEPKSQPEPAPQNGTTMKVRARGRKGRQKPPKLPSLTETQKDVMKSIQKYMDAHGGQSPTYTELAKDLNKSGVATIVHAIENKGWIHLNDKKYSRKIELLQRV